MKQVVMKAIEKIFEEAGHQADALIAIYKLYVPDFDNIKMVHGHPEAGRELWLFIAGKFIEFDKRHHHKVMPGGIWLNTGFSHDEKLDGWEVSLKNCSFEY